MHVPCTGIAVSSCSNSGSSKIPGMLPSTEHEVTRECEHERELMTEDRMPRSIVVGLEDILVFGGSDSVLCSMVCLDLYRLYCYSFYDLELHKSMR